MVLSKVLIFLAVRPCMNQIPLCVTHCNWNKNILDKFTPSSPSNCIKFGSQLWQLVFPRPFDQFSRFVHKQFHNVFSASYESVLCHTKGYGNVFVCALISHSIESHCHHFLMICLFSTTWMNSCLWIEESGKAIDTILPHVKVLAVCSRDHSRCKMLPEIYNFVVWLPNTERMEKEQNMKDQQPSDISVCFVHPHTETSVITYFICF